MPNLEKLDLKENQVKDVKEFGKLKFPKLKSINVNGNPCAEEIGPAIKTEILILFEDFNLKSIDKDPVSKEEVEEAKNTKEERIKQEAEVKNL